MSLSKGMRRAPPCVRKSSFVCFPKSQAADNRFLQSFSLPLRAHPHQNPAGRHTYWAFARCTRHLCAKSFSPGCCPALHRHTPCHRHRSSRPTNGYVHRPCPLSRQQTVPQYRANPRHKREIPDPGSHASPGLVFLVLRPFRPHRNQATGLIPAQQCDCFQFR